ncbi:MAG: membrane protein insertase YidC [Clostridia bacterium]|nr:membrane protein insertase YidC [Clostridia bacterium]
MRFESELTGDRKRINRLLTGVLVFLLAFVLVAGSTVTLLRVSAEESDTAAETAAESSTEQTESSSSGTESETGTGTKEEKTDWSVKEVNLDNPNTGLSVILRGIGFFLNWMTRYLAGGNYIVMLFIFAILLEIVLLPLSIKQQKTSIKQARLRPKEMAIRKKYAGHNDRETQQKMNMEIQQLYQSEHFSPFSGCLPLLIQLPIVMILYAIVVDPWRYSLGLPTELSKMVTDYLVANGQQLTSTRGTIELLSKIQEMGLDKLEGIKTFALNGEECFKRIEAVYNQIPNFNVFGINTGYLIRDPQASKWLYAVPVLTFGVYFGSMKLNRLLTYQPPTTADAKAQGCSNNVMDIMMPLFSVYVTFIVPAAVGIYWIFKSLTGTLKQFILKKAMPYPEFTEEEYKAAEREILGKAPKKRNGGSNVTVTGGVTPSGKRSLHHIDDDEYEEGYQAPPVRKAPKGDYVEEDEPKKASGKLLDGVEMKEDEPRKTEQPSETTENEPKEDFSEFDGGADFETGPSGDETDEKNDDLN